MKKFLIIFLSLFAVIASAFAGGQSTTRRPIGLEIQINSIPTKAQRTPLYVSAYYDESPKVVEVIADSSLLGEVYIYLNGTAIDYSPTINSTFILPPISSGTFTISIIGEYWTATGVINP